ncbi:hypothetical protein [Erythrobacter sp. AP23]|uniref:hypothetical protein n=1 Tax=Erythrobacter sp. AP23 TaxID=499656 RepID=UPI00076BEF3B|nr:hypothetical protein [Erythrobacter sp. AP23]KWV96228.1 hypothetical protein ASS64_03185 [Erythrobacter sp. AP23]
MIRQSLLVVLPLALAACGEARTEPEPIETSADTVEEAKVLVDANGLGPAGAAPFRFGAARADVDAAISEALAIAPGQSRNEECGAGPMDFSQFGPLQIAYMDGELRGWFLREGEGVATSDGVQPGTTTFEGLKLEKRVRELDTTLEGEFEYTTADYGTITGFAEDGESVTALQAGISCFFR